MFELAENRMCQTVQPHLNSLYWSVIEGRDMDKTGGVTCVSHGNDKRDVENGAIPFVQGCCVQVCRIDSSVSDNIFAYFVSGTKGIAFDGETAGSWERDERCEECWGIADIQGRNDQEFGAFCKSPDETHTIPRALVHVQKLRSCGQVEFLAADGQATRVPQWILLNETRPLSLGEEDSQDSQPSSTPDSMPPQNATNTTSTPSQSAPPQNAANTTSTLPQSAPNSEKGGGGGTSIWAWLGPVIGALIAGFCAIIATRCARPTVVRTSQNEGRAAIDEVEIYESRIP